ncbi:SIS domain-containing protein [Enterococcus alcedinis]|uniref:Tagatose-6-phosphate ketose n=1 Tax=Enterococcus alcedinis TaxID=1274384 RepID=A0A917JIR1_9ENTE|nr:SIS domain-containing protein [Enterococcus alcedinis]MBP2102923.1 tagatose-6-phosphate ketose/aldose isomerase [Enterococcus alcedinis]GGI66416.1 tagatose-6-phosphate ketose [Enterococcus alcedinis]
MYQLAVEELVKMGAEITTREIRQQPELWAEAFENYQGAEERITAFLATVKASTTERIRIIFTGAGTSQYVGDILVPYLSQCSDKQFIFQSVGTTDIVASPEQYFSADETTIVVSFARSGNSPESVATVDLANKIIKNVFHMTITCAKEGALAKAAHGDERNLLLLMPERSNDVGFAMTGSFSCMTLTGLLVFDTSNQTENKATIVQTLIALGEDVLSREAEIQAIIDRDFDRIVYLGSGSLSGLTREAQLKVLELTAGKVTTVFDSSLGFRHGPKSFVNERTLLFDFISNNPYTRQYDVDILEEVNGDQIAAGVIGIGQVGEVNFSGENFVLKQDTNLLPDGYLALAGGIFAQTISLLASIKVGNTPDTPSPTGTVNRVVKGVIIHEY